ncbi:ras guanine nucleotide exchange factor domain-containing protein [Cristinia sonorae]|uniref:Ras guanine nucleotide exchange factor domain-containing protein n=1 Tax=Cristinia sonorae TaxID=1940300 RepID=A0A8K0XQT4_9AGAR|nr:ras guanine nucleotide exchange factor domain-containing protein [Cristinia sonorae]
MMQNNFTWVEQGPSVLDNCLDGDTVYPSQSQRLNGHVAGGNGGTSSQVAEGRNEQIEIYHFSSSIRERLAHLALPQTGEEALDDQASLYASPLSPIVLEASEGIVRAISSLPESAQYGRQSPELWRSSSDHSPHHFVSPLVRPRQMSWDYPDGEAPPPYTPVQPPSLSPATPSLSSGSLSAIDSPFSQYLASPISSPPIRYRSLSSAGMLHDASPNPDPTRQYHRKRSASSSSMAKEHFSVSRLQSRPSRQLPAPPSQSIASPTKEMDAETFTQGSISVPQQETPIALFGRVRKAIAVLAEYVRSVGPMGQLWYGRVIERVSAIVESIKVLLYITAMPVDDCWYDTLPDRVRRSCTPRYVSGKVRSAYWKVIATLSSVVTATIALQHDPALSVADSRLEVALPDLEAAVRSFVREVQQAQQEVHRSGSGLRSPIKPLRGNFLSSNPDVSTPGAGSGGSWKGLGYVQQPDQQLRNLDAGVLSELNVLVGPIERKLLGLVASSSSSQSKLDRLQSEGQLLAGQLSELLQFLGRLDVTRHDYVGPLSEDADERARLIRSLEAAVQALYDDSATLLTTTMLGSLESLASSSSNSDPLGALVTAIMANLSLVISTLRTLVAISGDKPENPSLAIPEAAASPRRISNIFEGDGTLPTDPETSVDLPGDSLLGDIVDMELALFMRPIVNVNNRRHVTTGTAPLLHTPSLSSSSSLALSGSERSSTPNSLRPTTPSRRHLHSPSTTTVDSAASWTANSIDSGSGGDISGSPSKSPQRATKLFQILGRDAPRHYIDSMNTDLKPWFLRPTYVQSEIRIEPNGEVTAGTRTALVERLTAHDHGDPMFNKDFLMTFKSFMTVNELVDMLIERYWIEPPDGMNDSETREWRSMKQHVVRTRVLNTLKSMITDDDILESSDMYILPVIKKFITAPEVLETRAAKQILPLVERLQRGSKAKIKTQYLAVIAPPTPILPKTRELKVMDIDPLELARQLTLMESSMYKKIRPSECLQRVREPNSDKSKDSIAAVIRLNTRLVNWVVETILSKSDAKKRGQTIKHFVQVADRCRDFQNYSSMFAIVSALNKPEIRRLSRSWEQVSQRTLALFSACEALLDPAKKFSNYWTTLEKITPPCIPFFGRYLSTLTFINDGAKDNLSKGQMINFRKRQKAAGVIRDIKKWQSRPYNFQSVAVILAFLEEALNKYVDGNDYGDQWWKLSLEREPRERNYDAERLNRLLHQSGL